MGVSEGTPNPREPKKFPLDERGQPHPIDLIRDLRHELGMFDGAMPVTPQQAYEEAINALRKLRSLAAGSVLPSEPPAPITRIPLTVISAVDGARTEGVVVGVLASDLDALEAHVASGLRSGSSQADAGGAQMAPALTKPLPPAGLLSDPTPGPPSEVTQTILADNNEGLVGNCLQAAVASLLELPLLAVPHFAEFTWYRPAMELWARGRGLTVRITSTTTIPQQRCIVGGRSHRGVAHVCIAEGGVIVWDPHPDRTGLASIDSMYEFVEWQRDDASCWVCHRSDETVGLVGGPPGEATDLDAASTWAAQNGADVEAAAYIDALVAEVLRLRGLVGGPPATQPLNANDAWALFRAAQWIDDHAGADPSPLSQQLSGYLRERAAAVGTPAPPEEGA